MNADLSSSSASSLAGLKPLPNPRGFLRHSLAFLAILLPLVVLAALGQAWYTLALCLLFSGGYMGAVIMLGFLPPVWSVGPMLLSMIAMVVINSEANAKLASSVPVVLHSIEPGVSSASAVVTGLTSTCALSDLARKEGVVFKLAGKRIPASTLKRIDFKPQPIPQFMGLPLRKINCSAAPVDVGPRVIELTPS